LYSIVSARPVDERPAMEPQVAIKANRIERRAVGVIRGVPRMGSGLVPRIPDVRVK
jgi:hypothetical protein